MTQVSRYPLSKDLEIEMHRLLQCVFADLGTREEICLFLDDLLTPTEKIMLGKRLAIAFLLEQGRDHRTIQNIMHVSLGTVSSVHFWLKNKGAGYRMVIERMTKQKQWATRINRLNDIFESFCTLHLPEHMRDYRKSQRNKDDSGVFL